MDDHPKSPDDSDGIKLTPPDPVPAAPPATPAPAPEVVRAKVSADTPDDLPNPDGTVNFRLKRAGGIAEWFRTNWVKRWFRWLTYLIVAFLITWALFWAIFARGLPSAESLKDYQPPLPTIVRDSEGNPIHSYARDRRVQLDYGEYPPLLVRAYLAAEDRTFFEHGGIDYPGLAGAVVDYVSKLGSGERAKGGSTITQQVAKNLLLGNEYSVTRKVKEAILARRIEGTLTKERILELYLNQIPLGRRSFGVQAAARAYFGKDVADLALNEMAFLAILPKAPEVYGRPANAERAINRRNWALKEMYDSDWITAEQRDAAMAMPLGIVENQGSPFRDVGGYYMEEVRRELKDRFGETAKDGIHSVYAGGLWVRTAYNDAYQKEATKAMRTGLLRYDGGGRWSGPLGTIEADEKWASRLQSTFMSIDYEDWRVAAVLKKANGAAQIGFADGKTANLPSGNAGLVDRKSGGNAFNIMKPGDLIVVKPVGGNQYALRSIPAVSGGMIVQNPTSGRVHAMQGGFDALLSPFNRATQANRQPGSTIKPFVYATAMDNGLTPASIIVDGPFCVYQSASLGRKCFRNSGGGNAGPQTIRWGLEQSRNLMTVRTANTVGMPKVVKTFERMGIGSYQPYLAFALGAGDTTVAKLTNAYSMLVNHGKELKPRLIDYVQDRNGKVILPEKWKACGGCNAKDWDGKPMPRFTPDGKQLMDPITAFQMVHIMEGVIQRGTAKLLKDMNRPVFGKTGTTTGPTNVWFIGGTPDLVAGVYMGFDEQNKSLGGYAQGGTIAAPIFKQFMKFAVADMPVRPFVAPKGVRMVRIERKSGKRVYTGWPSSNDGDNAIIWEAFKADSEPRRSARKDELPTSALQPKAAPKRATSSTGPTESAPKKQAAPKDNEFLQEQGGIY